MAPAVSRAARPRGPPRPRSVLPDALRQVGGPKRVPLRSLPHPPAANPLGSRWGWGGDRAPSITISHPPITDLRSSHARGNGAAESAPLASYLHLAFLMLPP